MEVPEFWQLSVLHGRVSDKVNKHDPPQDSAIVFFLFLVCVPLVPHWWEQWLQCDQGLTWQERGLHGQYCLLPDSVIPAKTTITNEKANSFNIHILLNLTTLYQHYEKCCRKWQKNCCTGWYLIGENAEESVIYLRREHLLSQTYIFDICATNDLSCVYPCCIAAYFALMPQPQDYFNTMTNFWCHSRRP